MSRVLFAVIIAAVSVDVGAQSSLPPCQGKETFTYSSCYGVEGTADPEDGSGYRGEWLNGYYHGQGTLDTRSHRYVGEFRAGKFHGQGTLAFKSAEGSYVGEFQKNEFHGTGTWTFANGDLYIGKFEEGRFEGSGTYTWVDGRQFVGEFSYSDTDTYASLLRSFVATGVMKWPNGARYEGEVRTGIPDGIGTLTFPDGSSTSGRFERGKVIVP